MWYVRANWAIPVVVSTAVAVLLHVNTLGNDLVWDDRAAVMYNPDVTQLRPLRALWTNDFWGQDMALPDSHKSYRPLAVLSLRLNHAFGGLDPWGYHVVNLALHALATAAVVLLAWTVADCNTDDDVSTSVKGVSGKESRSGSGGASSQSAAARLRTWFVVPSRAWAAWTAGLVFAIHPVHVEPVASAVGRADLLCGSLALVALLMYLSASPELQHRVGPRSTLLLGRGVGWVRGRAVVAFGLALCATFSKELGVTTFGLFACHEIVEALVDDASAAAALAAVSTRNTSSQSSGGRSGTAAPLTFGERFQGVWLRTEAPIVRAVAATVRRFVERPQIHTQPDSSRSSNRRCQTDADGRRVPSDSKSSSNSHDGNTNNARIGRNCGGSSSQELDKQVHAEGSSSGAAFLRLVWAFGAAVGCVLLHLSLHGDTALYAWTLLENHVALMPDRQSRVLTYAHVHARYAWKLLWPFGSLCYDHGHECLPTATTWRDPVNAAAFVLYASMLLLGRHALAQPRRFAMAAAAEEEAAAAAATTRSEGDVQESESTSSPSHTTSITSSNSSRNTSCSPRSNASTRRTTSVRTGRLLLWGLALLVAPFVPASHVLFPIGTVLGERLLYLPSAGYALLVAHAVCILLHCAAMPQHQTSSSPSTPPQKNAQSVGGKKEGAKKAADDNVTTATAASAQRREMSPRCLQWQQPNQQQRRSRVFMACVSLVALGSYGVALGAASWARNFEWATEIALFESALRVCPRSLKVLNNLALRLMEGNAPQPQAVALQSLRTKFRPKALVRRAGSLLDTCLSIHPGFAQAQYNKGLVHFYLGEHLESLPYFEAAINLARSGSLSIKNEEEEVARSSASGGKEGSDDPRARSCLARAYYRLGLELQEAAELSGAGGRAGGASREELRSEAAVFFRRTLQVLAPLVTTTSEHVTNPPPAAAAFQPSIGSSSSVESAPSSLKRPVVHLRLSMPIAHLHAGLAWAELREFENAQVQFQACLAANHARGGPHTSGSNGEVFDVDAEAGVYNSLGNALRDLKRPQEALAAYQKGATMASVSSSGSGGSGSGCFECLANAAGLRMDMGDVEGALMAYSTARQLAPHSAQVANNLGYLHERQGAFREAAQLYREALQLLGYPQQRHPQIETNLRLLEEKIGKLS